MSQPDAADRPDPPVEPARAGPELAAAAARPPRPEILRPGVSGIPDRCAPSAERRGDQLHGSAAPVRRWLLVEQPGAWGRDAVAESNLDSAVAATLAARAAAAGTRLTLIRRPGRSAPATERRWAYVDAQPGREGVWWGGYSDHRELLDLAVDRAPGGQRSAEPVYLVCTHGSHDPCCAIRGRTVAAALAAARPAATWECSHVGGDRFAANVVVLPHGLYYGHVQPDQAAGLALAYEQGRVVPARLRGRSSLPAPEQAAQHYARRELGEDRLDALALRGVERLSVQRWRVTLDSAEGPVRVTVAAGRMPTPVRLTCQAHQPKTVRVFSLVGFEGPARRR
jgi:hypothetical protein